MTEEEGGTAWPGNKGCGFMASKPLLTGRLTAACVQDHRGADYHDNELRGQGTGREHRRRKRMQES